MTSRELLALGAGVALLTAASTAFAPVYHLPATERTTKMAIAALGGAIGGISIALAERNPALTVLGGVASIHLLSLVYQPQENSRNT